jgi:hypothetical protein
MSIKQITLEEDDVTEINCLVSSILRLKEFGYPYTYTVSHRDKLYEILDDIASAYHARFKRILRISNEQVKFSTDTGLKIVVDLKDKVARVV